jgi:AmpD protein
MMQLDVDVNRQILSSVAYIPSPNCDSRPLGMTVDLLVIHGISLPPNQFGGDFIVDLFCNRLNPNAHPYFATIQHLKVSAHILIRRDGRLLQFVPFDKRAWHAGLSHFAGRDNCNDFSIGIELEGADHIPYEQIQYHRLASLTICLQKYYPLITADNIVGHSDISPGRKTDPGEAFDWHYFKKLLTLISPFSHNVGEGIFELCFSFYLVDNMTLLAVLICFGIQRYLHLTSRKRDFLLQRYTQYGLKLLGKMGVHDALASVLLLLIPIVLIVGIIELLLQGWWFNIFEFLFNVVVLFYCMDARDLRYELHDYFQAQEREDRQAAFHYGNVFLGQESADDMVSLIRAITRKIFLYADLYIFSVIFWYILLGPIGAVIYATLTYFAYGAKEGSTQSIVPESFFAWGQKVQALMDWVPERITGLTYALMGHFAAGMVYWYQHLGLGLKSAKEFAFGAGLATLELDPHEVALASFQENKDAINLVGRTCGLWVTVIALFTVVAWIA